MKSLAPEWQKILQETKAKIEDPAYQERLRRMELEDAAAEQRRAEERRVPGMTAAGVPPHVAKLIVGPSFREDTKPVRHIQELDRPLCVLSGSVGCGKTTAAVWYAERTGKRMIFVTASELAGLSRSWADKARFETFREASVFILDDLGVEANTSDALRERLDELLDKRTGAKKLTLVTANITEGIQSHPSHPFEQRYGDRVWSRIHEHGRFFQLLAPDLRRQQLSLS